MPLVQQDLTAMQRKIVEVFRVASDSGAAPPTLRELCAQFGWQSTATARDHLRALVRRGALRRGAGARNYRLANAAASPGRVPVVGTVSAGRPILAVEHLDGEVVVPAEWTRAGGAFAVRVEGESMTGAGILDGDTIIASANLRPADRDIVVARFHDEVTVKRLRLEEPPMLAPENPNFKPIPIDEGTSIEGVVVALLRELRSRRHLGGAPWAQ